MSDQITYTQAQKRRLRAFAEGVYELSEDEGYECPECGWKGLSAPMNDDVLEDYENAESLTVCPECGSPNNEENENSAKYIKQFHSDLGGENE